MLRFVLSWNYNHIFLVKHRNFIEAFEITRSEVNDINLVVVVGIEMIWNFANKIKQLAV